MYQKNYVLGAGQPVVPASESGLGITTGITLGFGLITAGALVGYFASRKSRRARGAMFGAAGGYFASMLMGVLAAPSFVTEPVVVQDDSDLNVELEDSF